MRSNVSELFRGFAIIAGTYAAVGAIISVIGIAANLPSTCPSGVSAARCRDGLGSSGLLAAYSLAGAGAAGLLIGASRVIDPEA